MLSLGPFSVEYPVNFRSGGDTTKEAFWKHIQEIERIYGLLTAIDAAAASSDSISGAISGELQRHINSTNPHPNWKPSLSFDDITGNLAASRVVGKLTNATIDAGKISGLSALIGGQLPPDKGDGITTSKIQENGYAKFNNGLMLNWGNVTIGKPYQEMAYKTTFSEKFPTKCLNISLTIQSSEASNVLSVSAQTIKSKITQEGFEFFLQYYWNTVDEIGNYEGNLAVSWLAIGY